MGVFCRLVEGLPVVTRGFNAGGECGPPDQLAGQAGEVGHRHGEGHCSPDDREESDG